MSRIVIVILIYHRHNPIHYRKHNVLEIKCLCFQVWGGRNQTQFQKRCVFLLPTIPGDGQSPLTQ
jgi:hypothetical protein